MGEVKDIVNQIVIEIHNLNKPSFVSIIWDTIKSHPNLIIGTLIGVGSLAVIDWWFGLYIWSSWATKIFGLVRGLGGVATQQQAAIENLNAHAAQNNAITASIIERALIALRDSTQALNNTLVAQQAQINQLANTLATLQTGQKSDIAEATYIVTKIILHAALGSGVLPLETLEDTAEHVLETHMRDLIYDIFLDRAPVTQPQARVWFTGQGFRLGSSSGE